jgi:hypothetical protein
MARVEISGTLSDTVLKIDGEPVKDAFKYELSGEVGEVPVIKVSVLVTDLVVDVDEVEGAIERLPLVRYDKPVDASA